jgi:hypothetical protein
VKVFLTYLQTPWDYSGLEAHAGIDFNSNNKCGHDVFSPVAGEVVYSKDSFGTVSIKDDRGIYFKFLHLQKRAVEASTTNKKSTVKIGDKIGEVGGIGEKGEKKFACHLHIEVTPTSEKIPYGISASSCDKNKDNKCSVEEVKKVTLNPLDYFTTTSTPSLTTPSNGSSVSGVNIKLAWTNPNELKTHRWIISTDKLFIDGLKNDTDWEKECKNQKTKCYTSQVSDKKTPASTETGNLGLTTKNDTTYYWKVRSNTDMSPTGNFIISKITSIGISCSPTIIKAGGKGKCIATANYDIKSKVNPEDITINSGTSWSIKNNSTLLKIGLKDGKFNAMKVGTAKIVVNYLDATANGQEIKVTAK